MDICLSCYKKLEHRMFKPFDYEWTDKGLKSTCCNANLRRIDGRKYHKIAKTLKEQKQLEDWQKQANNALQLESQTTPSS